MNPLDHRTMEEKEKIARAAGVVGAATLLSRVFGFIRDMVVAQLFGAGNATDAFFVAFRIPNLLRRLVGEGALTASFIPIYSEYLIQHSQEESNRFVQISFTLLTISLSAITLLGIAFSPWIVKAIAYGFSANPEKFGLTVLLNRLMFPYIFFISLVALSMGVLNSLRHFSAPAFSPVILNLSIIACALLGFPYLDEPILSLALGVLIGGMGQLLFQIPFLYRKGIVIRWRVDWSHPGVRRVLILMGPSVLGLAVSQLNVLVNTLLASYLPQGSVSYLYYADRLLEFPMGIFAIAIATAVLPSLSDHAARKDWSALRDTMVFALRLTFFLILPAMAGLIILRNPIIQILFQRGAFDAHSTTMTAQALFFYALGLIAFAGIRIVVPAFYALQDTKTPVKIAGWALLANLGFGILLMSPLKHGGLALAVSLSAGLNFILLMIFLRKKIGSFGGTVIWSSFFKNLLAAGVMSLVVHWVISFIAWEKEGVTFEKIIGLLFALSAGAIIYWAACRFMGCEEAKTILNLFKRKIKTLR
jgi:putative peptidoglycan lipid II flippase